MVLKDPGDAAQGHEDQSHGHDHVQTEAPRQRTDLRHHPIDHAHDQGAQQQRHQHRGADSQRQFEAAGHQLLQRCQHPLVKTNSARRHPLERVQQGAQDLAMAAGQQKRRDAGQLEQLAESCRGVTADGIDRLGQRHAAHLTDPLATRLQAGHQHDGRRAHHESQHGLTARSGQQLRRFLQLRFQ
jgi:hypothetical protein